MDERGGVVQNLRDAGLDDTQIGAFLLAFDRGQTALAIRQLRSWRPALVEEMHRSQRRVDCLDYLTRRLEKEQKEV
jgi:hypothetical protein